MTITHTVKIPDDYRVFLDFPRSVPSGILAKINIDIPSYSKAPVISDPMAFWKEFDTKAASSQDEILQDEDFPRTNTSRPMELVSEEN